MKRKLTWRDWVLFAVCLLVVLIGAFVSLRFYWLVGHGK